MPLFEINTISIFKHKYIVNADSQKKAINSIGSEGLEELEQKHVTENLLDIKSISKKEFDEIIKNASKENFSNSHLGEKIIYKA